jgi:DNA recombination protein RmuC
VSELGRELHERLSILGEHFVTLGKRLDSATAAYNHTLGSLERRVLPTARRFADLGVSGRREIPALSGVDRAAQVPQAPELSREAEETVLELPTPGGDVPDAEGRRDAA